MKLTKEMAIINLQLANILPFDKNTKGYIQYNKYISDAQVSYSEIVTSLQILTNSNEGENWKIVAGGGETKRANKYRFQYKVVRIDKEVA